MTADVVLTVVCCALVVLTAGLLVHVIQQHRQHRRVCEAFDAIMEALEATDHNVHTMANYVARHEVELKKDTLKETDE